jgi:hypothetical protein
MAVTMQHDSSLIIDSSKFLPACGCCGVVAMMHSTRQQQNWNLLLFHENTLASSMPATIVIML